MSVLCGGPGTGKSRTVAAVVAMAQARGLRVALAAPTGRAAKRLEELAGAPATTVHRLLGAQTDGLTWSFSRNEEAPVEADLVVVDEASMLDAELAAALVEACPDGARLLLVGDPAQLPSIGPGRVLADLIDSGAVPVTELTRLYRQQDGGVIARLATAVRGGTLPAGGRARPRGGGGAGAGQRGRRPAGDPAGHRLHPAGARHPGRGRAGDHAGAQGRGGDRRAEPGAQGAAQSRARAAGAGSTPATGWWPWPTTRTRASRTARSARSPALVTAASSSSFPAGPVCVPDRLLGDLRHGWALTVHRAQGSEWPAVVAVFPAEAAGMLSRPLAYTALTRAQRHLSIVHGAGPALARAVATVGEQPRVTRLASLVT